MKSYAPFTEVQLNPIPVLPRLAAHYRNFALIANPTQSLQRFQQDIALLLQLKRVFRVLILPTAALPELLASRLRSSRICFNDFRLPRPHDPVLHAPGLHPHRLARQHIRHQNDLAIHPRQSFAAVYQLFDRDRRKAIGPLWVNFLLHPLP